MEPILFFWLVIACLFLIAEVGHPGLFFFLPFSAAALITAAVSIWQESLVIQGLCFLSTAALIFLILHRWLKIRSFVQRGEQKTNTDALIGKRATVVKNINDHGTGYVKIDGQDWLARSIDGSAVQSGAIVEIVATRGAHLLVKKL